MYSVGVENENGQALSLLMIKAVQNWRNVHGKKKKDSAPVQDHKVMFFYRLNKYIMPKLLKEKKEKTQMKIEWVLIIYQ